MDGLLSLKLLLVNIIDLAAELLGEEHLFSESSSTFYIKSRLHCGWQIDLLQDSRMTE
jgi:hypothetical protein